MKKLWNILIAAVLCITLGLGFFNFSQGVGVIPTYQASIYVPTGSALGDVLIFNGTTWTRLAGGTAKDRLTTNGTATVPYWTSSVNASNLDTGTVPRALMTSINASNLDTGTVPIARIGSSGTPSSSTYYRGDDTWAISIGLKPVGMLIAGYNAPAAVKALADYTCNGTASYHDEIKLNEAFAVYVSENRTGSIVGVGTFTCNGTINIPPFSNRALDFSSAAIHNYLDGDNVVIDSFANAYYYFNVIASMVGFSSVNSSILALRPTTTNTFVGAVVGNTSFFRATALSCNGVQTSGMGIGLFLDSRNVSGGEVFEDNDIQITNIEQVATGILGLGYTQRHNRIIVEEIRETTTTKIDSSANSTQNYYECAAFAFNANESDGLYVRGDYDTYRFVGATGLKADKAVTLYSGATYNTISLDFNAANVGITDSSASRTNMFKTDIPVFVRLINVASQNLVDGAGDFLFGTETDDLYGLHSTSSSNQTVNIKIPGYYSLSAGTRVSENATPAGTREFLFTDSIDATLAEAMYSPIATVGEVVTISTQLYFAAGDYVVFSYWHDAVATLTATYAHFEVAKLN